MGWEKYPTNSGGDYELMVCRSGRYQSILNGGNGGGKGNPNGRVNQQNQRQNIMFLQQEGNLNGFPPDD